MRYTRWSPTQPHRLTDHLPVKIVLFDGVVTSASTASSELSCPFEEVDAVGVEVGLVFGEGAWVCVGVLLAEGGGGRREGDMYTFVGLVGDAEVGAGFCEGG